MIAVNKFFRCVSVDISFKQLYALNLCSVYSTYHNLPSNEEILSESNKEQCIERLNSINMSFRISPVPSNRDAAVLIPLCVVDDEVSLLYTLRTADLKRHSGQVSFPGGMKDDTDSDLTETALRETEEELGISPKSVRIWGTSAKIIGRDFSVLPVVGQLGIINLNNLKPNPMEVQEVFSVSLRHFCCQKNCRYTQFRLRPGQGYVLPAYINAKHRIWGMTALMTHLLLTSLLPNHYTNVLKYVKPLVPERE